MRSILILIFIFQFQIAGVFCLQNYNYKIPTKTKPATQSTTKLSSMKTTTVSAQLVTKSSLTTSRPSTASTTTTKHTTMITEPTYTTTEDTITVLDLTKTTMDETTVTTTTTETTTTITEPSTTTTKETLGTTNAPTTIEICTKSQSKLTAAMADFTVTLYKELWKKTDPKRNLFVSPFNVATVLSMLNIGAKGETARQLQHVLFLETYNFTHEEINKEMGGFLSCVKSIGNVTLEKATLLYVANDFSLVDYFQTTMMEHFGVPAQKVDFADDTVRIDINKQVEDLTNQMIKNILPFGSIGRTTKLILLSAIHFNASWKLAFDSKATQKVPFYLGSSRSSVKVPTMMHSDRYFRYGSLIDLKASVIDIPYESDLMSMFIILPDDVGGLPALVRNLNSSILHEIDGSLASTQISALTLPKFEMNTNVAVMKLALMSLGLLDIFSPTAVDLSGMSDDASAVCVTDLLHRAAIKVNEQGTKASAILASSAGSTEVRFEVNHPALFFIRDNRSKLILFIGHLVNPSRTD